MRGGAHAAGPALGAGEAAEPSGGGRRCAGRGSLLKPGGDQGPQPPAPETRPYPLETPPARRCRSGSGARGRTCRWTGSPRCPGRKARVTPPPTRLLLAGQPGHSPRGDSVRDTPAVTDRGWQGRRSHLGQAQPCQHSPSGRVAPSGSRLTRSRALPPAHAPHARLWLLSRPGTGHGERLAQPLPPQQQGTALPPRCGSDHPCHPCKQRSPGCSAYIPEHRAHQGTVQLTQRLLHPTEHPTRTPLSSAAQPHVARCSLPAASAPGPRRGSWPGAGRAAPSSLLTRGCAPKALQVREAGRHLQNAYCAAGLEARATAHPTGAKEAPAPLPCSSPKHPPYLWQPDFTMGLLTNSPCCRHCAPCAQATLPQRAPWGACPELQPCHLSTSARTRWNHHRCPHEDAPTGMLCFQKT